MESALFAIFLTFIAGSATAIGAFLGIINKKPNKSFTSFTMAFSAGVMTYISFVELFHQSLTALGTPMALILLGIGIGLALFIDIIIPEKENVHEHYLDTDMLKAEGDTDEKVIGPSTNNNCKDNNLVINQKMMKIGLISMLGIFIHNFPEGLATFSATLIDAALGFQIMLAIMLHNIPEGMSISVPIYMATGNRKKAFAYATISGLAEPLGAIVAWLILAPILTNDILMGLYAFVAGIMIYISIDVLIPTAKSMERKHISVIGFTVGLMVIAVSLIFL
jgi:ZIP family zinc transporter